jgi:hypothetical protein
MLAISMKPYDKGLLQGVVAQPEQLQCHELSIKLGR